MPGSPIVAELFGLKSHGVIFAFTDAGFTIGTVISPVLIGYIFDITGSYQLGFLICVAVSILGLLQVLLIRPLK